MKKNTHTCLRENLHVLQLWYFPGDRQYRRKQGNFWKCGKRLPQERKRKLQVCPCMQPPQMFLNSTKHIWSDCSGFLLHSNSFLPNSKKQKARNFLHFSLPGEKHFLPASQYYFSKPNQTKQKSIF